MADGLVDDMHMKLFVTEFFTWLNDELGSVNNQLNERMKKKRTYSDFK